MSLVDKSLRELSEMLKTKQIMATELLNEYLKAALKGSCITFCSEQAFRAAGRIDERIIFDSAISPLEGFPFSVKDNICTAGLVTTCNSKSMKEYVPDFDAFVVERLNGLGAFLAAKNCMREFSVGKIEDSAFELRNYLDWTGTNKNVNIGAFSVGTDVGMCDFYCGLWTFKPALPAKDLLKGVISGSPSLERTTFTARRGDDLGFIYNNLFAGIVGNSGEIDASGIKVLVYDNLNMSEYTADFLEACGFSVVRSDCAFLDKAILIYDCILCTEFFTELYKIGMPETGSSEARFVELEHLKNRAEGLGFETKRLILTGAHLFSENNKAQTMRIIESGKAFALEMASFLKEYDFIAAPAVYGDALSKASAVASLAELTVPFGDVLPFKLYALPENERLLLDLANFFEQALYEPV